MENIDLTILISSFSAVQVLLAWWIKIRLTESIKHEYDKKLQEYKQEQLRKEKAAVVAEFLAEWTHLKGADTKRLNQLLWELSLYLPSQLVRDVKSMVSNNGSGKTAPEVLVAARNYLLGGVDLLTPDDIAHFKHPDNASMRTGI